MEHPLLPLLRLLLLRRRLWDVARREVGEVVVGAQVVGQLWGWRGLLEAGRRLPVAESRFLLEPGLVAAGEAHDGERWVRAMVGGG